MGKNRDRIDILRAEVDKLLPPSPDLKQKILVIDDEYRNLRSFKSLLRKTACVYTALNLNEALEHLKSQEIDIIFCDYKMFPHNGADVLSVISREYPKIKRVALSGYLSPDTMTEFEEKSNTKSFLWKPFTFDEVNDYLYSL